MIETLYVDFLDKFIAGIVTFIFAALLLYSAYGVCKVFVIFLEWLAGFLYGEFRCVLGSDFIYGMADTFDSVARMYFVVISALFGITASAGLICYILFTIVYIFSKIF